MKAMFVDGRQREGSAAGVLEVRDPSTGELVETVPAGTAADVDTAVQAAQAAFPQWWETPAARRGEALHQATAHVRGHLEELTGQLTQEQGKPLREARLELERWAALVCEALRSWGGTAERLVGGSAVAVFGIPRVHEDDAARGLRAGLEILDRSPLPVRVGVATGEVIAPAGHGTSPREIAGEALDAASRLREAAEPGTVLAAERTCRAAGARFRYGEPVRLPGLEPGARRVAGLVDDPAAAASGLRPWRRSRSSRPNMASG